MFYTAILLGIGDFETALAHGEKVTINDPGHFLANNSIELSAFRCGDFDKVMEAAKYILPAKGLDFKEVERVYELSGFVPAYEEALRQLEILAQKGYSAPVEMATHSFLFEPLFDNPRFIEILQKMNLPLPEDLRS